jgi:hypothetical protein
MSVLSVTLTYKEQNAGMEDAALLDRAQELGRVLFSRDDDLVREATRRQREGLSFSGVIYAHQRDVSIGRCTLDLYLIAEAREPEELRDRVIFLPF